MQPIRGVSVISDDMACKGVQSLAPPGSRKKIWGKKKSPLWVYVSPSIPQTYNKLRERYIFIKKVLFFLLPSSQDTTLGAMVITGTSPSDCLLSYPGHSFGGVLPLCRGAVGVFYFPSRLGKFLKSLEIILQFTNKSLPLNRNSY